MPERPSAEPSAEDGPSATRRRAFRLIREDRIKQENGHERPTSANFTDHWKDGAMSVFLEEEMAAAGKSPGDLLKRWPGYRLSWLYLDELKDEFGQEVTPDPIDDFPGHYAVRDPRGKRPQSTRTKMAQRARWEDVPESGD